MIDMSKALYPVVTIRDEVVRDTGIHMSQWYYHQRRFEVTELSGWKWFTAEEAARVKQFFTALALRKAARKNASA